MIYPYHSILPATVGVRWQLFFGFMQTKETTFGEQFDWLCYVYGYYKN